MSRVPYAWQPMSELAPDLDAEWRKARRRIQEWEPAPMPIEVPHDQRRIYGDDPLLRGT